MVDSKLEDNRRKIAASAQGITFAKTAIVGYRRKDWVWRKSKG